MRSARTGIKPQNMLPHEEKLFTKLRDEIKKNRVLVNELMDLVDGKAVSYEMKERAAETKPETKLKDERKVEEEIKSPEAEENYAESVEDESSASSSSTQDSVKIEILKDVPAFVGIDLNKYGPWKKGEILNVPRKIAEALIKTGRAREA
jgi:DNA replication initiation complex subunit (GINS family)